MAGHAQRDLVRSWLGLPPHKIPIVGKPGTVALMADTNAWNTFEESAPDDFVNEACARITIRIDKYKPINHVDKIDCPVLLQACDYDFALPLHVVEKAVSRLGQRAQVIGTGQYRLQALAIKINDLDFHRATITIVYLKTRIRSSCPKCKASLAKRHQFCAGCGTKVDEVTKRQYQHRRIRVLPVDTAIEGS